MDKNNNNKKPAVDSKAAAKPVTKDSSDKGTAQQNSSEKPAVPAAKKPIIRIINIKKDYLVGKNIISVLKGVSVDIFPEEFIVILGPSGSGKSTLMNSMLGLEPPSSGKVIVEGEDLTIKTENQLAKFRYKRLGIVFQRAEWVRALNVVENVALPLSINGYSKAKRLEQAWMRLKQIGMDTHGKYIPSELSGGQQQKVTLARALINDPRIIVADEPTGNLDSSSSEKVMDLFKELNEKQHKTILMVTHNIDYVRYASRTIYIRDGNIIQGSEQFLSG